MFSFFRKKPPVAPLGERAPDAVPAAVEGAPAPDTPTAGPSVVVAPAAEAPPAAATPPLAGGLDASAAAPKARPEVPAVPAPSPETATETPAAAPTIDQVAAAPADATAPAQPLAPAVTSAPTAPAAEPDAAPVAAAESSTASRPRWWTPPWSKTTAVPVSPEAPAQASSGPQSPAPAANLTPVADGAAPTPPTLPPPAAAVAAPAPAPAPSTAPPAAPAAAAAAAPEPEPTPTAAATERKGWLDKLKAGLRKTGSSLATVFTGTRIDDELYEELETALLMADTGVKATEFLLADLKRRVKETKTTDPAAVKGIRVVRQGFHDVDRTHIVEGTDPRGYQYYWFGLGNSDAMPNGTDLEAIAQGYVTVTPLHYDLTKDAAMASLAEIFS